MDIATTLDKLDQLSENEISDLSSEIIARAAPLEAGEDTPTTVAALHRLAGFARKVTAFTSAKALGELGQTVTASAGRPGSSVATVKAGTRGRTIARNPEAASTASGGPRVLLASGAGSWIEDHPVTDKYVLAEAVCETLRRMDRQGPPRGRVLCASAFYDYPEDRTLTGDPALDARKLDAACGLSALLASGGICLPTNVSYEIPTWATADRPLRDGLPSFDAARGGLIYVEPPSIGTLGAATGIWTEATDAEPLAATKPVYSVSCGATVQVYCAAVATRVGFGNMQSRFQPELVAANTDLAIAEAARKAEINLLELIQEKCLKDVTSAKVVGATRDLITAINAACANFRFTNRLPRDVALTAVFPAWVMDLIKVDLAREAAHQQDNDFNSLAITDEQVLDLFKAHGIEPIFTLDGLPEKTGGSGYPAQTFAVQGASEAMKAFPTKVVWNLFPAGAIQFLDGGRLDLGVVRDATLDSTNDYEVFWESFEAIADRGFSKSCIQYVTELCANGGSGATVTVSGCP